MTVTDGGAPDEESGVLSQGSAEAIVEALRVLVRRSRALNSGSRIADTLPTWLAGLLAHLEVSDGGRLGELADGLCVTASTLSRQLAHAETLGYAARTPDPDDRRAANVTLTAAGADALARHRAAHITLLRQAIPDWSDADAADLVERMMRLADAIGQGTTDSDDHRPAAG
ncbi:MarR family winged helix-turn-helix transcriptional regulator [Rhodococcus yananensis]|uniref:MarR family winged helix-turn-helix transcriptional regulator n=1 Tax=Rhodococcus yananensis TaxID=2879464 RepID=UPI003EB7FDB3